MEGMARGAAGGPAPLRRHLEDEAAEQTPPEPPITKADLFALGLTGGHGQRRARPGLLRRLELPEHLTANGLLEALNLLYGRSAFLALMAGKDSADGI